MQSQTAWMQNKTDFFLYKKWISTHHKENQQPDHYSDSTSWKEKQTDDDGGVHLLLKYNKKTEESNSKTWIMVWLKWLL